MLGTGERRGINGMITLKNKREIMLWLSYIIICIFVLGILGPDGAVLTRDSRAYYPLMDADAVKLLYPIFLNTLDVIFGADMVFQAAVAIQILIASICVITFVQFVRTQFSLSRLEAFLCLLFALYPFTINYPESMITHEIMTEALSYALFYPFMMYLLKAMFTGKVKYLLLNGLFAFLLTMTRSQLLLIWTISMFGLFYIGMKQIVVKKFSNPVLRGVGVIALSLVVFVAGLTLSSIADSGLRKILFRPQTTQIAENGIDKKEISSSREIEEMKEEGNKQSNAALFARAIYASDREDVRLFEEEEMQGAFLAAFDEVDSKKHRYPYSRDDLYRWKDIAEACNKNTGSGQNALRQYYQTIYKNEDEINAKAGYAYGYIANTLFREHWDRYLEHTIAFLPSGFISTVFIQKEQFYGLCHFITLLLYIVAAGGVIWGYRSRNCDKKAPEFMLAVIITALAFVIITNLVFMGLQRYLIYPFGTFYIALYLLFRSLAKDKVLQIFRRKNIESIL